MNTPIVLGIDPGLKGALAWYTDGRVLHIERMPVSPDSSGDVTVDGRALYNLFQSCVPLVVVYERQHTRPTDRKKAIFTLGRNYGSLQTAINLLVYTCSVYPIKTYIVDPKEWKEEVLRGTKKDKEAAIGAVLTRYPKVSLKQDKEKNYHDGTADAVLIAEYGWKKYGVNSNG